MKIIEPHIADIWVFEAKSLMTGESLGTPEQNIEMAGRTCYKSEDQITQDSADDFVRKLRSRKHFAMIEHGFAGMRIMADRGLTHELVRHRLCSFAQESTRYCNYSKGKFNSEITIVKQPGLKAGTPEYDIWKTSIDTAEKLYMKLLDSGVSAQIARSVLPIGLLAEIVITANLREWRHIFKMRCAKGAHPIIRGIMLEALERFAIHMPAIYEDQAAKFL